MSSSLEVLPNNVSTGDDIMPGECTPAGNSLRSAKSEVDDSTSRVTMSIEDLSRAVGSIRAHLATRVARDAAPDKHLEVSEKVRVAPVTISTRKTTSRDSEWCKMSPDGFTPIRSRPAVKAVTEYDSVTATPVKRTWWRIDPFSPNDVVTEIHETKFPCVAPIRLARDITLAWQMYSASDLTVIDRQLLANTPLTVEVDGVSSRRYVDMWGQLVKMRGGELDANLSWRVLKNGEISSR